MTNPHFKVSPANWLMVLSALIFLTGADILTDPTRPPDNLIPAVKDKIVRGPLELTAIFIYPDHRFAFISDHKVSVGDKVDEYTVININRDTVELMNAREKPVVLTLLPTVKQPR
jgi:hypothetical protein